MECYTHMCSLYAFKQQFRDFRLFVELCLSNTQVGFSLKKKIKFRKVSSSKKQTKTPCKK